MIEIENIKDFNLDHIFDCGQCFRWSREQDGSYTGIAFGKPVNMNFIPYEAGGFDGRLIIDNGTQGDFDGIWKEYLDLGRDYSAIKAELAEKDEIIRDAIAYGQGIRILNQENWETLISFIISQNSNIPRIKKCIETLCENFGEEAGIYRGKKYYSMPKPCVLAELTEEQMGCCRLGYRAKYLIETAKQVAKDGGERLDALGKGTSGEAFEYLTSLCGVGPKVANCILLFSVGKQERFPIDVWVRRVMHKLYNIDEGNMKAMAVLAEEKFGRYGGFAQQYLFYYIRAHAE